MISFAALKTVILYHIATYTYQYKKKSSTKLNFELVTQIYMCTRMDKYVDTYLVRCMDKQSTQAAAALNSGTSNNSEGLILSLSYKKESYYLEVSKKF